MGWGPGSLPVLICLQRTIAGVDFRFGHRDGAADLPSHAIQQFADQRRLPVFLDGRGKCRLAIQFLPHGLLDEQFLADQRVEKRPPGRLGQFAPRVQRQFRGNLPLKSLPGELIIVDAGDDRVWVVDGTMAVPMVALFTFFLPFGCRQFLYYGSY